MTAKTTKPQQSRALLHLHALFPYLGALASGLLFWMNFGWREDILWVPVTPIHAALLSCCLLSLVGSLGYLLKFIINLNKLEDFFAEHWNVLGIILQILTGILPVALYLFMTAGKR